jgi:hypothetical protein
MKREKRYMPVLQRGEKVALALLKLYEKYGSPAVSIGIDRYKAIRQEQLQGTYEKQVKYADTAKVRVKSNDDIMG